MESILKFSDQKYFQENSLPISFYFFFLVGIANNKNINNNFDFAVEREKAVKNNKFIDFFVKIDSNKFLIEFKSVGISYINNKKTKQKFSQEE